VTETPEPPPQKIKRVASRPVYWAAYVAIIAAALGLSLALGTLGAPAWLATLAAMAVAGIAIWYLVDSPLNPEREQERDPYGRTLPTIIRHWLRARSLRGKQVVWRPAREQNLPAHVEKALMDHANNGVEVAVTMDGLVWAIAEADDWDHPEPPLYSVMAFDSAGQMQALDDFYSWPKGWAVPAGSGLGRKTPRVRRAR
jgi:hypothetical protein